MPVNRRWNSKHAADEPVALESETEVVTITSEDAGDTAAVVLHENHMGTVARIQASSSSALPITYSIVGGVDAALFEINATTGVLAFAFPFSPDYEAPADSNSDSWYQVIVQASDGVASDQQAWTVQIIPVNEAPFFTSYGGAASVSVSISENSLVAGSVAASDPEGMTSLISYAIAGGADAALFVVNPWNGSLSFRANPDFEAPRDAGANNVYDVTVRATDQTNIVTQSFAVTVTNAAAESSFTGTLSGNTMNGTTANDVIMGIDGGDTLSGLGGDDLLDGGPGADYLVGGAGADLLMGGAGVDRFRYDAASDSPAGAGDWIWDFSRGQGDKILLSGVDANSVLAGDQAFTFISTSAFSGAAGELRYVKSGGNTHIYGDLDGDAVADFQISMNGEHNLYASDFVL